MMLTLCLGINAQIFQKSKTHRENKSIAVQKTPLKVAGTYEFSYCNEDIETTENLAGFGLGQNATANSEYNVAIKIPETMAGQKINSIKFVLTPTYVKNVKAWASSTLPKTWSTAENFAGDVTFNQDIASATFSSPIEVPAKGCYVGYSFAVTSTREQATYPVITCPVNSAVDGSIYLACQNPSVNWQDCSSENLVSTIVVTMTADNLAEAKGEFAETTLTPVYAEKGSNYTITGSFANKGAQAITTVSYTIKDIASGLVSEEKTATVATPIKTYKSGDVVFEDVAGNEITTYDKEITITKVNGTTNEATENLTAAYTLNTLAKKYNRKVVEEEATATGCPPCARGYAGMKALEEKYPDNWIGIAAHISGVNYKDPMYCSSYSAVTNKATGVPTAWLNRINTVDPYFGTNSSKMLGIIDDMEAELAKPVIAGVTVKAEWDEEMKNINVTTNVEFGINSDDAKYGIAYALLANGLKAPEDSKNKSYWYQNNAYYRANAEGESYLEEWTKKKSPVKDMVYDHVAISAKNLAKGMPNSIVAPIVAGETQTHNTSFNIGNGIKNTSGDDLIQDKNKLVVVAMLINQTTGEILNADKCHISNYSGIKSITNNGETTEVARYTIDGVKLTAPQQGLNIVKMSDGSTIKVMVK